MTVLPCVRLAAMFSASQLGGLAFPTAVVRFDCDVPEHQSRAICQRTHGRRERRRLRRLQGGSCPQ